MMILDKHGRHEKHDKKKRSILFSVYTVSSQILHLVLHHC